MIESKDSQQDLPPWKRTKDAAPAESSASDAVLGPDGASILEDLSSSEEQLQELARANDRASRVQVVENFENLFFHDDFFRLVGIGAVGGFALSTILIVIVLEFTDRQFAETFPQFWYLFPTLTIVGFVAWTLLLLKVRVHRRTKKLREIAFGGSSDRAEDASAAEDTDQETPPTTGPRHSAPDEKWL
ncbi:MAG: hypothetical protein CMJ33_04625 [Phycisphaerae bacterium]|nr:hypothetical protein [Phycisphaerae bacterium]